jgi:hypothetical protein
MGGIDISPPIPQQPRRNRDPCATVTFQSTATPPHADRFDNGFHPRSSARKVILKGSWLPALDYPAQQACLLEVFQWLGQQGRRHAGHAMLKILAVGRARHAVAQENRSPALAKHFLCHRNPHNCLSRPAALGYSNRSRPTQEQLAKTTFLNNSESVLAWRSR